MMHTHYISVSYLRVLAYILAEISYKKYQQRGVACLAAPNRQLACLHTVKQPILYLVT